MASYPKQEKRTSKPTPRSNGTGKRVNHNAGVKTALKAERRADAVNRQSKSDALSPEQKIKALDTHFGKGLGAKRERERLARKIAKAAEETQAAKAAKTTKK